MKKIAPKRPPKAWFSEKEKEVREGNPDYTDEQVRGTVGSIWWESMSEADRQKVLKSEGSLRIRAKDVLSL